MTATLREMVVEHINSKRNEPEYRLLINTRVAEEFPELIELSDDITVSNFLNLLSQDGVWGSGETCLAVVQLFDCEVNIHT